MSDIFERILLLKKSPMFSEAQTEDLRTVAQAMEEETFFKGDRIFDINGQGDNMYIIQHGQVGISLNKDPSIKGDYIATLSAGDCFGEMNLLDDQPRSASAHALKDTSTLTLEKERLRGLIINYPELSLSMLRSLSLRIRNANETH